MMGEPMESSRAADNRGPVQGVDDSSSRSPELQAREDGLASSTAKEVYRELKGISGRLK
jgi:hypothetical protein